MIRRLILLVLLLTPGVVIGLVLAGRMRSADEVSAQSASPAAPPSRPAPTPPQGLPDLTGIAERAVSAVTSISSTQIVRNASPFADDPIFGRIFGQDIFGPQRSQSLGSGVIVSPDGYVLTNAHVVGDERSEVSVILSDKRELRAKIVGTDEATDLAVLKIQASKLPTLPWGDSSRLKVAEWVLAIGNPFGVFNQSVTLGIISATGRSIDDLSRYEDFIQTDAAINKGNSGGALINARGELVGINSAIYSETGGYQGVGLAVPSNVARRILDELVKNGVVRRGTISGIQLEEMTTAYAERLGAPDTKGVLVAFVDPHSPAAAAGLERGDVIVGFNGRTLDNASHFIRLLSDAPSSSSATLQIIRDRRKATIKVPIDAARPSSRGRRGR
ncbi:MAG TPA: trypsin-like peptidase domain-containing protein [Vicinamibacterales bacterium]|nr:trypsin-like peptidase domain-containing protein [Vicinamibacterales bacterium]